MLGYVTIGVTDFKKAIDFYLELLAEFDAKLLYEGERIAFIGEDWDQSLLSVCIPFDKNDPHPGNGNMLAFPCNSPEQVDKMYAKAMDLGCTDEGEPGQRLPVFYGAYFRDPDGNKCCFFEMKM